MDFYVREIHVSFDDPLNMEEKSSDDDLKLDCNRTIRDQLKEFIIGLTNNIK